MPFEVHQENSYSQEPGKVYDAALKSAGVLQGKVLGKVLGDRIQMTCVVQADGEGSKIVMDIYPLDAVGRKLMFGARKGVSEEVLKYFIENLEGNL